MKVGEKQFIDEFMDRLFLCGNKTGEGKYVLDLYEAEEAAKQLHGIVYNLEDQRDKDFEALAEENSRLTSEMEALKIAIRIKSEEVHSLKSKWMEDAQNSTRDENERHIE